MLPRAALFLLLPLYARFMSAAELGSFMLMVSLAGLLAVVFRFGVDAAVMRFHFDASADTLPALYWTAAALVLAATISGSIVASLIGAPLFPHLFVGLSFWPLGAMAISLAALMAFQFVPTVWLRATEQPGRYLVLTATSFLVIGATSAALVAVVGLGAVGSLTGHLVGAAVMAVAALVILGRMPRRVDPTTAGSLAGFGLPLLPHGVSQWVLSVSDRWLIGLLIGLPIIEARAQIGIYSLGYQVAYVIVIVAVSVQAAWTPQLYRRGETPAGPELHRSMVTVTMAVFLWMASALALASPYVTAVLAPPSYQPAASVMAVVAFGAAGYGAYVMIVGVIMLTRRPGLLPVITIGAAIVNVLANVWLIPRIGIHGAAVATVAAYWAYAVSAYFLARTRYPIRMDWPRLAALGVVAVASLGAGLLADGAPTAAAIAFRGAALVMVTIVVALVAMPPLARLRALMGPESSVTGAGRP
jgi:O-antigen/teichoic acid export membrane protein